MAPCPQILLVTKREASSYKKVMNVWLESRQLFKCVCNISLHQLTQAQLLSACTTK